MLISEIKRVNTAKNKNSNFPFLALTLAPQLSNDLYFINVNNI